MRKYIIVELVDVSTSADSTSEKVADAIDAMLLLVGIESAGSVSVRSTTPMGSLLEAYCHLWDDDFSGEITQEDILQQANKQLRS